MRLSSSLNCESLEVVKEALLYSIYECAFNFKLLDGTVLLSCH